MWDKEEFKRLEDFTKEGYIVGVDLASGEGRSDLVYIHDLKGTLQIEMMYKQARELEERMKEEEQEFLERMMLKAEDLEREKKRIGVIGGGCNSKMAEDMRRLLESGELKLVVVDTIQNMSPIPSLEELQILDELPVQNQNRKARRGRQDYLSTYVCPRISPKHITKKGKGR